MSRAAKGADCNSAGVMPSQVRVLPGPLDSLFDNRFLYDRKSKQIFEESVCLCSSGVERILGKNEVMSSILIRGSVPRPQGRGTVLNRQRILHLCQHHIEFQK